MKISYRDIRTIEFLNNYNRHDIEENLVTFKEFLNVLIEIQDYISKSKIKFPLWKLALDPLISKFILHCNSFGKLISGIKLDLEHFRDQEKIIIDIPSSQILLRAQLENFLIIDFIYFQPQEEDECKFRFLCWDYSNLKSLSKYKAKSKLLKDQIIESETKINELWGEIEKSNYLMKYSKQERKKLKNYGDSRLSNSWNDLIAFSNLNPMLFDNLYSILSKHAHTESFSVFYLKNSKLGYHKNNKEANLLLIISISLICLLIIRLCEYIKTAEIKFNTLNLKLIEDIKLYATLIDKGLLKDY
jgi:hypothetical protein